MHLPATCCYEALETVVESAGRRSAAKNIAHLDDLLAESDTSAPHLVLRLKDGVVRVLPRPLHPHGVEKLVARPDAVGVPVGQDHGGTAAAKQRVLEEEAALVAVVKVGGDGLRRANGC